MSAPMRRRWAPRFCLRTLFLVVTLVLVVGNGVLVWWRAPFVIERRTTSTAWEHFELLRAPSVLTAPAQRPNLPTAGGLGGATQKPGAPRQGGFGAAAPVAAPVMFRERRRVYRGRDGEHIEHGPLEVFGPHGRRLRLEHWSHGRLHGPWTDWDPDGNKIGWGEHVQGEKHGRWRERLPSILPGTYTDAVYDQGELRWMEEYRDSKIVQRQRYDSFGKCSERRTWKYSEVDQTTIDGAQFMTGADGVRRVVISGQCLLGGTPFVDPNNGGLESGVWEFWNKDGVLVKRTIFDQGRILDEQGKLAPPILPPRKSPESAHVQQIRRALDSPTAFAFDKAPYSEALSFMARLVEIPLHFDTAACRRAGISLDEEITLELRSGCSLRAALQIVAAEAGVAIIMQDDVLLVTTPDAAVLRARADP